MQNRRVIRNLFILVLAMIAVSIAATWVAPRQIIPWRADYDAGVAEARAAGKPVMLYFTADWCEPCKRMKRTTWADPAVRDALAGHVPIRIDIDKSPAMAKRFGVNSVPRLIILDDAGEPLSIRTGYSRPSDIIAWLGRAGDQGGITLPSSQPVESGGVFQPKSPN